MNHRDYQITPSMKGTDYDYSKYLFFNTLFFWLEMAEYSVNISKYSVKFLNILLGMCIFLTK